MENHLVQGGVKKLLKPEISAGLMGHLAFMQTWLPFQLLTTVNIFSFRFHDTGCPAGWVSHKTSCFRVIDTPTLKWSDARKTCQDLAADLAIIRSATENNFIFDLIRNKLVWLGLYRKANTKFYWIDDTPLEGQYSAWGSGEPSNLKTKCATMSGKGSRWNDIPCSLDEKYSASAPVVLCQKANN